MFAGNFNAKFRRETPISLGETSYSVQKRSLQSAAATHNNLFGVLGKDGNIIYDEFFHLSYNPKIHNRDTVASKAH